MGSKTVFLRSIARARNWVATNLAPAGAREAQEGARALFKRRRARVALACALVFLAALGVRLLHRQDASVTIQRGEGLMTGFVKHYEDEAARMAEQGRLLFPAAPPKQGDARMIIHPPGYSMLILALYGGAPSTDSHSRLVTLQIIMDSVAAALVCLIAASSFPLAAATVAGLLVALSPHLAYYSLWLTPDSLTAVPILAALYLIARAVERPRLLTVILAGASLGASCWLRSNALLLSLLLSLLLLAIFKRGKRARYAAALALASLAVIAPITIRNMVVFDRFIPLSIGAGVTMVEGIADYDTGGRHGMPADDKQATLIDARWHGKPEYASNLWVPDGIERDQYRLKRGIEVIRGDTAWFLGVMLRRAAFMLRYNGPNAGDWPLNTSQVPVVSNEPAFNHRLEDLAAKEAIWSCSAPELAAEGEKVSPEAQVAALTGRGLIELRGDGSQFGDQFASAAIAVKPNTDYVLAVAAGVKQGAAAAKVTDAERRIALASAILTGAEKDAKERADKKRASADEAASSEQEPLAIDSLEHAPATVELPFASGARSEVRLVISNNGAAAEPTVVEAGGVRLFEMGPTPMMWTRTARALVRGVQRNLFTTALMLSLIIGGAFLLALGGRGKALAILLAVPVYYLTFQSLLHTEYRYILPIHYFLFILAGVFLYSAGAVAVEVVSRAAASIKRRRSASS